MFCFATIAGPPCLLPGTPLPLTTATTFLATLALATGVLLLVFPAPYGGRYSRPPPTLPSPLTALLYGGGIPPRLAWSLQEAPSVLVAGGLWAAAAAGGRRPDLTTLTPRALLLAFFCAHYAHRATLYAARLRGSTPTPAFLVLLAFTFCAVNGALIGVDLATCGHGPDVVDGWFVAGGALALAGAWLNVDSDARLRALRKPGETGYRIPHGGGFAWGWSSPNLIGEVLEWAGFAAASRSPAAAAFAVVTAANLLPRALSHHKHYQALFGAAYPARWAILPGVL